MWTVFGEHGIPTMKDTMLPEMLQTFLILNLVGAVDGFVYSYGRLNEVLVLI